MFEFNAFDEDADHLLGPDFESLNCVELSPGEMCERVATVGNDPAALNEGLADFLSAAFTGDPVLGEYVEQYAGLGRRLDHDLGCPQTLVGERHLDGRAWAAALYSLWEQHGDPLYARRASPSPNLLNLEARLYVGDRVRSGQSMRTVRDEVDLQIHLSDPDFAGRFEVAVWLGTVGGAALATASNLEVRADEWTEVTVALPGPGEHFVYLEILEAEPNRMAWTAPVWVERL